MNPGANANGPGGDADSSKPDGWFESAEDRTTGLAIFRTWPAVYAFVLVLFAAYILLLIALERTFP